MLKIRNAMNINVDLLRWFMLFEKKSSSANTSGGTAKSEIFPNEELAKKLHKTSIRKFENCKVHLFFINNVWGANRVDIQLLINLVKEFVFNYVLFIFSSKYAYVVPLKNKKGITITNTFQKILDE